MVSAGSAASAKAVRGLAPTSGASGGAAAGRPSPVARAPARRLAAVSRASSAARIAAMCAGVVPQQPPRIRAPRSSTRGTIEPKYAGSAA